MRKALLGTMVLSVTPILWGDVVPSGSINVTANTCAGADISGPIGVIGEATHSVSAPLCVDANVGTWSASATAEVDLLEISPEAHGEATTSPSSTVAVGSAAEAGATFSETSYIGQTGDVSVQAGAAYKLQISGVTGGVSVADATVTYDVLSTSGMRGPGTYFQTLSKSANGTYSGDINVQFTLLGCPCTYVFSVEGFALAENNATASFSVQSVVSTPEPRSFWLAGIGLLAIGTMSRQSALRRFRSMRPERRYQR